MGLTWLLAALAILGLIAPQADDGAFEAGLAVAWALAMLLVLALPRGRLAVREALSRHWLAAALFIAFLGLLVGLSATAPDPELSRAQAERSLVLLAALGLAALASAAAAIRQGPSDAVQSVLASASFAGVAVLLLATVAQAPVSAGLGLAGLCVLAGFALLEAMRRSDRAAAQGIETNPLARRLFWPAAAFLSCAVGLAATRDFAGAAAAVAGLLAFAGVYALRARPSQRSQTMQAAGAMAALVAALYLVTSGLVGATTQDSGAATGAALALWRQDPIYGIGVSAVTLDGRLAAAPAGVRMLAETGILGLAAAAFAALLAMASLALAPDRDRRPSRGGALCAGLVVATMVSACFSAAPLQPHQGFALACLLGLSCAYGDKKRTTATLPAKPARSSGPEPSSTRVGMHRL